MVVLVGDFTWKELEWVRAEIDAKIKESADPNFVFVSPSSVWPA